MAGHEPAGSRILARGVVGRARRLGTLSRPMAPVSLVRVDGLLGRLAFLRAAAELRREPYFTPDLSIDFLHTTSRKNPFFRTAEIEWILAKRAGRVVGRAAAIVDRRSNELHREKVVCFGYFEIADGDREATAALLDGAAAFGRARGMERLRGPVDLSTNYRIGLLVEGFERPPSMMMPWNPPGHAELLELAGLRKVKDVVAMEVNDQVIQTDRYERLARRALERGGYALRSIDMKRFPEELRIFQRVYNEAWKDNWGFVPLDYEELLYVAKGLKDVLRPELCVVAEKQGVVAAFSLVVPDVAIAIREIGGKLLPFGFLRLLRRVKTLDRFRVLTLGVLEGHRSTGLDAAMYMEITRRGFAAGIRSAEFGWMLEDNEAILKPLRACGATVTKRYRIYEREL